MNQSYQSIVGDCREVLKTIAESSVTLVVTSPPYADARAKAYGGLPPEAYVDWFLPIAKEIKRVLSPTGTFVLNIKEKVVRYERHTYVMDLIMALRKEGWLWTEEWIWHKKNCTPGKWPNRFRDSFERILQFNLSPKFVMNQEAVAVPIGDWAASRLKTLTDNDTRRDASRSGSGFAKKVANWVGKKTVLPSNVLHVATECANKHHPAAYPKALPEFFIKLLSNSDDLVLDPFQGSGTTGVAAVELGRRYAGIDQSSAYTEIAQQRMGATVKPASITIDSGGLESADEQPVPPAVESLSSLLSAAIDFREEELDEFVEALIASPGRLLPAWGKDGLLAMVKIVGRVRDAALQKRERLGVASSAHQNEPLPSKPESSNHPPGEGMAA